MKSKTWLTAILGMYLVIGTALICLVFFHSRPLEADVVAINRIASHTAAQWREQTFQKPEDCPYDYAILSLDETLLYRTSDQVATRINDAIRIHDAVADIVVDDEIAGKAIISIHYQQTWLRQQKQLTLILSAMFLLVLLTAVWYVLYLDRTLLTPFQNLQSFARHIAMGNLDAPLPMDQGHIFGVFTESFDIMREELAKARQKEAEANQSKKELTASLSHDIKTPVTSIKLISELLLVTENREPVREKLQTIYNKSEQIDLLITDMLHTTLEDLGQLHVRLSEESSRLLAPMIQQADLYHQVIMEPVPDCLLLMDPLRMEQVIDNIISNAYKYAGTSIHILSEITDGFLRLEFQDFGSGVSEDDLPRLFQKFYRGSNGITASRQGSGLGLFIARHLITEMRGDIQYFNRNDGFSVEILIPLVQA